MTFGLDTSPWGEENRHISLVDLLQDTENLRCTQTIIPTLKEVPSDAIVPSHMLLVRSGFMRQLGSGAYTYLPFGLRSLRKAEGIVREEMNRSNAIEILMPADPANRTLERDRTL